MRARRRPLRLKITPEQRAERAATALALGPPAPDRDPGLGIGALDVVGLPSLI